MILETAVIPLGQ